MNKEFVTYEQALALKELGFDEECLAIYTHNNSHYEKGSFFLHHPHPFTIEELTPQVQDVRESAVYILAPLYQQAFRWFREKHNLKSCIMFRTSMEDNKEYYDWLIKGQEVVYRHFNTYEKAELACLKKLIEIVKGGDK